MQKPLISIIVPCYNQAEYLDECLQSVLNQTYSNWECIIVNDGSPDDTEKVAMKWTAKDNRFKYLKKENGGLSSARNNGIEIAKGEWILPLDCDDKIGSRYLELASAEFKNGYTIIYCEAEYFGQKTGVWKMKEFSMTQFAIENVIFCSAFFKKSDWKRIGGYDTELIYGWEDWEFWIRLLRKKRTVFKINETLFFYRIKENSMISTFQKDKKKRVYTLEYIYKKHLPFFIENLGFYQDIVSENVSLRKENKNLHTQLNSKRHQIIDKFFKLINR